MSDTNHTSSNVYNNKYVVKIEDLTFDFAKQIVLLNKSLVSKEKEYVISKQMLKSGTSIAANVAEAMHPQSDADYLSKMSIALKEANETKLWIRLLKECEYISEDNYITLLSDCEMIIKILFSIVNKVKKRLKK